MRRRSPSRVIVAMSAAVGLLLAACGVDADVATRRADTLSADVPDASDTTDDTTTPRTTPRTTPPPTTPARHPRSRPIRANRPPRWNR